MLKKKFGGTLLEKTGMNRGNEFRFYRENRENTQISGIVVRGMTSVTCSDICEALLLNSSQGRTSTRWSFNVHYRMHRCARKILRRPLCG